MNLTKKDISKILSTEMSITLDLSHEITDQFIKILKDILYDNKNIKISSFGSFNIKKTPKRIGRNPKTKESYIIKACERISFSNSKKVRSFLNWIKV